MYATRLTLHLLTPWYYNKYMRPFTEERPWGSFRRFTDGEPVTVKILRVKPGQAFSLQYHEGREEFWHIVSGSPMVTCGEKVITAKPGDEFTIPVKTLHRIQAGGEEAVILEISSGTFDESDIVRVADQYGRVGTRPENKKE